MKSNSDPTLQGNPSPMIGMDGVPIREPHPNEPLIRAAVISLSIAVGLIVGAIGITYALRHPDIVSKTASGDADRQAQIAQASTGGASLPSASGAGLVGAPSVPYFPQAQSPGSDASGAGSMQSSRRYNSKQIVRYRQNDDGSYSQVGQALPERGVQVPNYTSIDPANVDSLVHNR